MWRYLTLPNCTMENGQDGTFYVMNILAHFNKNRWRRNLQWQRCQERQRGGECSVCARKGGLTDRDGTESTGRRDMVGEEARWKPLGLYTWLRWAFRYSLQPWLRTIAIGILCPSTPSPNQLQSTSSAKQTPRLSLPGPVSTHCTSEPLGAFLCCLWLVWAPAELMDTNEISAWLAWLLSHWILVSKLRLQARIWQITASASEAAWISRPDLPTRGEAPQGSAMAMG